MSSGMDGDASQRTMEAGASSALKDQELTTGIHEDSKPRNEPAGEKTTGTGTSMFSSDGAIGKQFTADGNIGKIGEAIGGPLSSQGMIGKQFTETGAIGGTINEHLGKGETNSIRK